MCCLVSTDSVFMTIFYSGLVGILMYDGDVKFHV